MWLQNFGNYVIIHSLVGFGQVQNGILYIRYRSSSKINTAQWNKLLWMKMLSYSNAKYVPRIPILLIVEKIKHENFDFVIRSFFFLLLLSFLSCLTQKLHVCHMLMICATNNCYVSELFFFWVNAVYKLRWVSYGSKHASQSLLIRHFVHAYTHTILVI